MLTNGIDLDNLIKINSANFAANHINNGKMNACQLKQKLISSSANSSTENLNSLESNHSAVPNEVSSNISSRASSPSKHSILLKTKKINFLFKLNLFQLTIVNEFIVWF